MAEQNLDRNRGKVEELGRRENTSFSLLQTNIFAEAIIGALNGRHFFEGGKPSLEPSKCAPLEHLATSGALEMHLYCTDTEVYLDTCLVFENRRSVNSSSLFFSKMHNFFDVIISCHVLSLVYF